MPLRSLLRRGIHAFLGRLIQPVFPHRAALLGVALCLPSLFIGWVSDDYMHRAALVGSSAMPEAERPAALLFAFLNGDRSLNRLYIQRGWLPWWSAPDLKLSFFRPISGLTHGLDYALWPESPWLMHVQSVVWYGLLVFIAAKLYRQLYGATLGAGLAGFFFAVSDNHGVPAVWLANRNALVASVFGLLAILAFDRWRRHGWRPGMVVSVICFLAALFSGETAAAFGGYILAYALFMDRSPWLARIRSIVPVALAACIWWLAYRGWGFGAESSGLYVDPTAQPLRYLSAVFERGPLLMWGLWAMPQSDAHLVMSAGVQRLMWWLAIALTALIVVLLRRVVRERPMARFLACGSVLSLLPACATFPSDRLLIPAGFGALGLLGMWLQDVRERAGDVQGLNGTAGTRVRRAAAVILFAIHGVAAPVVLLMASASMFNVGRMVERAAVSLPTEPQVEGQQVVIVHAPTAFITMFAPIIQALQGQAVPERTIVLGSSPWSVDLHREDAHTLIVRPAGGFLLPTGHQPADDESSAGPFSINYAFAVFDRLFRDPAIAFETGQRIDLDGCVITITEVTTDGRPAAISARFDQPLDEPSLIWLRWKSGRLKRIEPPAVGETLSLPSLKLEL